MYKIKLSPYANIFYTEWLLNPDSSRYNLVIDQTLYGQLDIQKLTKALNRYITEHVILNSHIHDINGEPHWIPNNSINELEYLDAVISTSDLLGYVSRSFDLHNDPLYRFKLIRLKDDTYRFIMVMHHLIMDGSASLDAGVFEAVSNYYNNEHYVAKYSIAEQIKLITNLTETLTTKLEQDKAKTADFWRQHLADTDNIDFGFLKLNQDNISEKSSELENSIGIINFDCKDDEFAKLDQIKLIYSISPYIYGQIIFAMLLHRYTSQDSLVIGYPLSIKNGLDFIYGAQLNTNLITYRFHNTITIIELINRSKDFFTLTMRGDIKYAYYPITNIISDCGNKKLLDACFTQAFFLENPFKFNGVTKVNTHSDLGVDSLQKGLFLFEQDIRRGNGSYRVRYDKNAIDKELLNNFITSYKKLFSEVLKDLLRKNDNKIIFDYDILEPCQYNKIVYEFNQTDADYPHSKTIHQLFEKQVLKTPNNIAVVYENTKLTYKELNQEANQLAHYLKQKYNIQPDDLIALCLNRSEQMLIAMLGVLKAGGAYVPVDPNYPDERFRYVLNDTKTKVILTNDIHGQKLQKIVRQLQNNIDILAIDSAKTQLILAKQEDINLILSNKSYNLAYVIYTSGTTGTPKGVMIEHHSVVDCITYLIAYNALNDKSIGSQYAAFIFDAAVIEIYPILLSGGSLCVVPEEDKFDPIKINNFFNKNKVTYAFLPTKFAELFFKLKNNSLINLIVAGEKLERFTIQSYRISNGYGPTENTVHTTDFVVNKRYKNIPIGKPINNVKCYVVDKNLNILPIGAIGELVIGGENLARGYLNRPELTQEKFITNPFQTKEEKLQNKNNRLYKTGDLVRMLPDGNLEYLGRNDFQVKIRGYRIELGDIENKMLNYPSIKQVVVVVKERLLEQSSDKYLLAYYVSDVKLDEGKLKDYLATQLPEYMLPQALVHLDRLPLTTNGKVDKKALPEPKLVNKSEYISPRNDLEKNICKIYAQVLNLPIEQIGITNDFFKVGGDSIASIQLVYRIRQNLLLNVSVTDIFTYRTVEQLVKNVFTQPDTQKNIINIKQEDHPMGRSEFLPIQEWFFDNLRNGFYKKYSHWNQSFIIKIPELDIEILKLSIEKLLQYHDAFRLRYKNFEKNYVKVDFAKELENIKNIDISNLTDAEIKNKLIEIQSNFDIETGPVYAIAYLYGYKDKTARLFFAMHHLIVDSVSWRILTHDISMLYDMLQDKRNANKTSQDLLGPKRTSYRQWAEELKNYKPSKQELSHWDSVLKDYTYISKNSDQETYGEFFLAPQLTQNLLTKANEAYNTQINDILLSALSRTLAQVFDRQVNHVTLEGHGREEINPEIDITKTMGWFTTMYPIRLVDQPTIADLIKTTKENLTTIPNRGIGYGPIKGYRNLPNISFNYLGQISNADKPWTIVDHIISIDAQNQNNNILDIYGYVINGTLKFHVSCDSSIPFNAEVIADKFKLNLEALINYCVNENIADNSPTNEISTLLRQVKLNYAQKSNEIQLDEQLQNKIDCYLKNANNSQLDLFLLKPIANILLTGSTGFLGCNLLNQLLNSTNYNIFVLVRANSQTAAIDRINKKFQLYFDKTLDDVYGKRVFVLKSDLTNSKLGLSEREYQDLSTKIDSVIHSAASTKLYGDYDSFYLHNVQATINLLEFTKLTKLKDFHYISTCSVLDSGCGLVCTEDDMPSDAEHDNAYLKTKLHGEYQTIKYREYGITSSIYRVGALTFIAENLRTQANFKENSFLNWVGCLFKLRCIAKEISQVKISPVDLTAQAIIKLFDKSSLSNKIHHVFNPYAFDLSEFTPKDSAYKIETLSIDKFIDKITNEIECGTHDDLIMRFLLHQGWMNDSNNINIINMLQDRTQYILQRLGFTWMQTPNEAFFDRYCQLVHSKAL